MNEKLKAPAAATAALAAFVALPGCDESRCNEMFDAVEIISHATAVQVKMARDGKWFPDEGYSFSDDGKVRRFRQPLPPAEVEIPSPGRADGKLFIRAEFHGKDHSGRLDCREKTPRLFRCKGVSRDGDEFSTAIDINRIAALVSGINTGVDEILKAPDVSPSHK